MSEPYSLEIAQFGDNMYVFNDADDKDAISDKVNEIFGYQHYDQFGQNRYAFAFKPGDYTDTSADAYNVGYYTQILGLGKTPYDVRIKNVKTPAALANGNVTCNFWVDVENFTIAQTSDGSDYWNDSFKWAVSQAAPARRLNVERQTLLQWTWGDKAWASGGYISDTKFHDAVGSWCQQQYYYRNCEFTTKQADNGAVYGINWNQVIQGCENVDGTTLKITVVITLTQVVTYYRTMVSQTGKQTAVQQYQIRQMQQEKNLSYILMNHQIATRYLYHQ